MSIPRVETISCPKCQKTFKATYFESINTDLEPNVAQSVIDGSRFVARCPACGFTAHLEYDVLYHDIKRRTMIYVLHPQFDDYAKKTTEIKTAQLPNNYTSRIVSNIDALREKVSCLETNLDDRVVEVCKILLEHQLSEDHPTFHPTKAFFKCRDGNQIITFSNKDGNEISAYFATDLYRKVSRLIRDTLQKTKTSPFITIDSKWAQKIISSLSLESMQNGKGNTSRDDSESGYSELTEHPTESTLLHCPQCNHILPDDSDFCQYCGLNLNDIKKEKVTFHSQFEKPEVDKNECSNDSIKALQTAEVQVPIRSVAQAIVDDTGSAESPQNSSMGYTLGGSKQHKLQYCKRCGGEIDNESRKCMKCGKQYLNLKTILPVLLLSLLSLCLISIILIQFNNNKEILSHTHDLENVLGQKDRNIEELNTTVAFLEKSVEQKDARISTQKNRIYEIQEDLEKANELASDYDYICKALGFEDLGYSSDHFRSSEKIVYVNLKQTDRKFTLTAYWDQGGSVLVEYYPYGRTPTAEVKFDNNSWNTSTTMTVVPKSKGVTLAVFYNDVDDNYFPVLIIVGDQEE